MTIIKETHPCSGGCGTPVTAVWDGKAHYCDGCEQAAYDRAFMFWTEMGVDPLTVLVPRQ
jgi:hypothetical protein